MDLSGTMQGAGGVGGLLLITDHSALATSYFPTFDGNGNVSEYLNSTGAIVAHYEYDPFGKTTVATGAKAQDFTHRFSTKPLDAETGLYYYGYRFYDPATGRWPSRDPIEEQGGVNLYGMVENDSVNWVDHLGLFAMMYCTRCKDGDGSMLCTIWEWDSRDDAFAGKLPTKTHKTETTNRGPNTEPDKGTGRNGSDDPYGSMGPVPPGIYDVKPRKSQGGNYPPGTPSITDRGGKAEPGSITTPGGTPRSHLYIHGPGRSDGCLTCKDPDEVKEIMDDNSGKGGMILWIKEVCCDKGTKTPSTSNDEF